MALPVDKIIPAYPFVQYSDDPNVVAFFDAYNDIAQTYLDAFNALTLPYWPADIISGNLLDWIAEGIYGEKRPKWQTSTGSVAKGAYDTVEYNSIAYAHIRSYTPGTASFLPDDYFKRILTWNYYKGDGMQFTVPWFKRRIARFIHGPAGIDPPLQDTFDISITSERGVFTIKIPDYGDGVSDFLKTAIDQRMVKLPFIYSYNVSVIKVIPSENFVTEAGDNLISEDGSQFISEIEILS